MREVPTNGHLLAVSPARTKRRGLGGGVHQTRTSDNNDACNRCGQDSNHRQHDVVGTEIGLQRLSGQSRGNALKSGVSANTLARKVPTNGPLLGVSLRETKCAGLVGGSHQTRTFDNNDGCNILPLLWIFSRTCKRAAICALGPKAIGCRADASEFTQEVTPMCRKA